VNRFKFFLACLLLAISATVITLPYFLKPAAFPTFPLPGEASATKNHIAARRTEICQKLIACHNRRPPSALLVEISAADASSLLAAYREQPVRLRRGLAWGLGYLASDEAAAALIRGLTDDVTSQLLTLEEETMLLEHLLALGFAAEKSDTAFIFLRQATDEEFWQRTRAWLSTRDKISDRSPIYFALQGLGLSGRPEAKAFLESCRQRDEGWRYRYASSVVQGLFYLAMRERYGAAVFRRDFTALDSWSKWEEWRQGDGREWVEWADSCRRGKRMWP